MKYQTEQKERLLAYLRESDGRQFTTRELADALAPDIGRSTVYRLIHELLDAGQVRRFSATRGRGVTYQYLPREVCASHLHMKCTDCGSLLHLDGAVSHFVREQILASCRFALDGQVTTLYGRCAACRGVKSERKGANA
jgi:Fur family ferric uptake transcriptional regulator